MDDGDGDGATGSENAGDAVNTNLIDRRGLRGLCVRRFPEQITGMQWERVQFAGGLRARTLEMGDLFEPDAVQACAAVLEAAASPADALAAWTRRKDG